MGIRKAVIPAAGLGTRFLPATKTVPKEMLPVVDRPAIDYVVSEAAHAGLDDVLLVTGRAKRAVEDYFDAAPEIEAALEAKGDPVRLKQVRRPSSLAHVHSVRQSEPRGLGHAVLCAREHVGDEPCAVLLGDDLIDARDPVLPTMMAVAEQTGGSVVLLLEVPREQIQLYGSAWVSPAAPEISRLGDGGGPAVGDIVRVHGMVEKPAPEDAPSTLAVIGRYVLSPAAFDVLAQTPAGRGGEVQLTDALATLAAEPERPGYGVHGLVFRGRRYDTGDKLDYLKAVIRLASEDDELGPALRDWLHGFVASAP